MAQLGARVNGIHEVTGSTPVWSPISLPSPRAVQANCLSSYRSERFRNFRLWLSRSFVTSHPKPLLQGCTRISGLCSCEPILDFMLGEAVTLPMAKLVQTLLGGHA